MSSHAIDWCDRDSKAIWEISCVSCLDRTILKGNWEICSEACGCKDDIDAIEHWKSDSGWSRYLCPGCSQPD